MKELKKSLYQKISPDKETIGGLLKDEFYRVPQYQRGYAWEKENISDFWDDINKQVDSENDVGHFFGILILAQTSDVRSDYYDALEVVDGQQRLITFIILLRALHDVLQESGGDRQLVKNIRDRIIEPDYAPRLKVGDRDTKFYTNWFIDFGERAKERKGFTKSEKLMRQAYEIIIDKIDDKSKKTGRDKQSIAREFWAVIDGSKKLFALKLTVPTEADAFTLFETINAKRVDLTASELIKNSVFGHAKKLKLLSEASECWESMLDSLSGSTDSSNINPTEYIRHLYISITGDLIRERELYRKVRVTYLKEADVLSKFLDQLADEAENYASIANGREKVEFQEKSISLLSLRTLNDINYKQIRPLLLSLLYHFSTQEAFNDAIRVIEAYAIRASLARISPSGMENQFVYLAKTVRNAKGDAIDEIRSELTKSAPSDESIRANIINEDARIPKVILKSMERDFSEQNAKDDLLDKAQLEHILPQHPAAGTLETYEGINRDTFGSYVNKFGNLTLLGGYNPRVLNKRYEMKTDKYNKSDFYITKMIADGYEEWGANQIKQRSEEIADYVLGKWKLAIPNTR